MSAPKLIEWSRDGRRTSFTCRYANRYPMVICVSLVLSLYSSCTCWIKLCMTLDSTWYNMYCTRDLLRLLIHGLASIFGLGRFIFGREYVNWRRLTSHPTDFLTRCYMITWNKTFLLTKQTLNNYSSTDGTIARIIGIREQKVISQWTNIFYHMKQV